MEPVQPPLPLASRFPFQPDAGSQTSILISESLVGFRVAATRQNAGKSEAGAAPPRPAGSVSRPASMAWAIVMVVFDSAIDERLSQEPATGAALMHVTGSNRANTRIFMNHLLGIFPRFTLPGGRKQASHA